MICPLGDVIWLSVKVTWAIRNERAAIRRCTPCCRPPSARATGTMVSCFDMGQTSPAWGGDDDFIGGLLGRLTIAQ